MTAARRFEAWVAPARAQAEPWRLAAGLVAVALAWLVAVAAASFLAAGPRGVVLGYLLAFGGATAALGLVLGRLHGRGFASLVGPGGFRSRAFATGAAIVLGVLSVTAATGPLLSGAERNLPLAVWAAWAPAVLAAVLVQTSAEELVFRGYLMQQLAARYRARVVCMGLPSLAFGALHWNPEFGAYAWAVGGVATVTGLVYADVTARTGNLSAAMGLHFANNAVAMLAAGPPGPLGAFALWRSPVAPGDEAAMRAALVGNVVVTLVAWGVWRVLMARRERALHSKGAGSI